MEWISVKDRLPDYGFTVWVTDGITIDLAFLKRSRDWFISDSIAVSDYLLENKITHWMPLPTPPKDV